MHLLAVHIQVRGKDQNVVKVGKDKEVEEVTEDVIDQGLENRGGIGQTERLHEIFIVPLWCVECCLPLISHSYVNQMVFLRSNFVNTLAFCSRSNAEEMSG